MGKSDLGKPRIFAQRAHLRANPRAGAARSPSRPPSQSPAASAPVASCAIRVPAGGLA